MAAFPIAYSGNYCHITAETGVADRVTMRRQATAADTDLTYLVL
jgi:hypothetical protein